MQQNVNDVIDHLAQKLSVPTAHLWAVLVQQVRVSVVQEAIGCVLMVVALSVGLFLRKRLHAWYKVAGPYDSREIPLSIFYIAMVAVTIGLASSLGSIVGYVTNPEYYALKEVLAAIGK